MIGRNSSLCNGGMKNQPVLAVRAIIPDENNSILILKRDIASKYGGQWCLPGGKMNYGQTVSESLEKEVKEETALIITEIRFLFYMDNLPENHGEDQHITLYFQCRAYGKIILNKESSEFVWIGQEQINKYDIAFNNDTAIKKFLKELG